MAAYKCPKGHESTEPDFCSECGAKIQGLADLPPAAAPPLAATLTPQANVCPDCAAPRSGDGGNFCEVCGYNFVTGAHGELAFEAVPSIPPPAPAPPPIPAPAATAEAPIVEPEPPAPQPPPVPMPAAAPVAAVETAAPAPAPATTAVWEATVTVDPALRDPGSPEPPAGVGPFTFKLDKPVNLIGRKSESRAIFPEIPLNFDDAVSHRHALITRNADGTLTLRDIGSSNGTRLNGADVEPMKDIPLNSGDVLALGHWTRVELKEV